MNITQNRAHFSAGRKSLRDGKSRPPQKRAAWGPFDYDNVDRQFLLIEDTHADQLSWAAAQALRAGRYRDAFMYADRRCRIKPIAGASEYLLRASALSRLQEDKLAQADLKTALEIDPNHVLANLAALRATSGRHRLRYATAIIRSDSTSTAAREAVAAIADCGHTAVGVFTANATGIDGWCAWKDGDSLTLRLTCDSDMHTAVVPCDPTHPLAKLFGHAAELSIEWPAGATYAVVDMPGQQRLIVNGTQLRPEGNHPPRGKPARPRSKPVDAIAIIIPIYGDPDATERCLASLVADYEKPEKTRVILVNDASPDPQIQKLVAAYAQTSGFEVITHKVNLGFARSVNDALAMLDSEDVIILNADTILPAGFASRLRKAAYTTSDIGTVTPFSNNGEYTSFPTPFFENSLLSSEEVLALDRIASGANAGKIVDLPNGTAFCMYVTRACLDAIGPLSIAFGKGYYEDVEFCLRAAKAGFRNVCATGIYVGHAGSKSFGASKRALVTRNLAALEAIYPAYRAVSAAFMEDDPLADDRRAIELEAVARNAPTHLILAGSDMPEKLLANRLDAVTGADRVWIATSKLSAGTVIISIRAPHGAVPQNITREFSGADTSQDILAWLEDFGITRVEFIDLDATPLPLVSAVLAGSFKTSLFVNGARASVSSQSTTELPDDDVDAAWALAATRADTLLAGDERTLHTLTARFSLEKSIEPAFETTDVPLRQAHRAIPAAERPRLAVIGSGDAATQAMLVQLITNNVPLLATDVVFIGAAFDDLRLMNNGRIFCTGEVGAADIAETVRLYQASHLLIADQRTSRGKTDEILRAIGTPVARFIKSPEFSTSERNLLIPAHASIPFTVDALNRWTTLQRSEVAYG